jgi:hypothetical protein
MIHQSVITDDIPFKDLNSGVVHVNTSLADGYNKINLPQMITPCKSGL